ncbi:MAG: M56 family metallopeptidase [Mucilaginibacter sp.]
MSWINYLLEANLYLAAFYALYFFILKSETYYLLNRIFLLSSTVLAFTIPVVQIGILLPAVTGLQQSQIVVVPDPSWSIADYFLLAYGIIVVLLLINFLIKIYKLLRLAQPNKTTKNPDFTLIELPDENDAFSFFNYLFISPVLSLSSVVIQHEMAHIRQKHSWDIVYLELLKIVNWFNPIVYLLQNSMKEVHEFIADADTANDNLSTQNYTDFLINNAYGINENMLTNTFFNKSLLKRRIIMLHKKRSGNAARLKYLIVLPLTGALLFASTLAFTKDYQLIDLAPSSTPPEKSSSGHNSNENKPAQQIPLNLTDTVKVPPPPPPAPPHPKKIHDQIKLPPKNKKILDQIKLPPPPPPAPPQRPTVKKDTLKTN